MGERPCGPCRAGILLTSFHSRNATCFAGSISKRRSISQPAARSSQLCYTFSIFAGLCEMRTPRRAVPPSVNLLATLRGPGKHPILFRAVVFLSTLAATKRSTRKIAAGCVKNMGYVRACMSTSCITWAIFFERPSAKFSSSMSNAKLAPACMHYPNSFTPILRATGCLPQSSNVPNVPTLAVQADSSSRNTPPRSLRSGSTLTPSFRR